MEPKFIIFIAFAILSKISSAQKQQATFYDGLSEEASTRFDEIVENQRTTIATLFEAGDSFCDSLEVSFFERKYHLQSETVNHSALSAEAFEKMKTAIDCIHDSISMSFRSAEFCLAAVEKSRKASHVHLDEVCARVGNATEMAVSGNHSDIHTQLETMSAASKTNLEAMTSGIYDAVRTCMNNNTSNTETLASIKVDEDRSIKRVRDACDQYFDPIRVLAGWIPEESTAGIIPDNKEYCFRLSSAFEDFAEIIYSGLRGCYMSIQFDKPELATSFISDQRAQILLEVGYRESAELMTDMTKGYLNGAKFGLSNACTFDSSANYLAQRKVAEYLKLGYSALVKTLVSTKSSATLTAARFPTEFFDTFADTSAATYFRGFELALDQGASFVERSNKIQATVRTEARGAVRPFVTAVFGRFLGGTRIGNSNHYNEAIEAGRCYADNISSVFLILVNACNGDKAEVSQEVFVALETAMNEASFAARNFTLSISAANVLATRTINARPVVSPPSTTPVNSPIKFHFGFNFGTPNFFDSTRRTGF